MGQQSRTMVNEECFFQGFWLTCPILTQRRFKDRLNQGCYPAEGQPAGEKLSHRNLICRIEHCGCRTAMLKRAAGERQSRETRGIGLLEGQRRATREIEPGRRPDNAPR